VRLESFCDRLFVASYGISNKRSSMTHCRDAPKTPPTPLAQRVFSRPKIYDPKPSRAYGLCDNGQKVRFKKEREP
jgi:hypothetical protein